MLRLGRTLLVGQSCRTSATGIEALAEIVGRFGYRVVGVPVRNCLHVKTACTALPDGRLLINPAWVSSAALPGQHTSKRLAVLGGINALRVRFDPAFRGAFGH